MTGFATSVIGCKCEAGIECDLEDTPMGDRGKRSVVYPFAKTTYPTG